MATEEIFEIIGDVAVHKRVQVLRRIPLEQLLSRVEKAPQIVTPTLPRTAVFMAWDQEARQKRMFMLCEIPPSLRTIVKAKPDNGPKFKYKLGMPWTYFWFTATTTGDPQTTQDWAIDEGKCLFSKTQYANIDHPLMVAPLPNVDGTGRICWGNTGANRAQNLAGQIDERVNGFHLSEFNAHLDRHIHFPYGEPNMGRWVRESAENPMSWMNWPEWDRTDERHFTVRQLMAAVGNIPTVADRFPGGGFIPPTPLPMTFGAWEEWAHQIPPEERFRALTAIQNMAADDPAAVRIDPAVAAVEAARTDDDGGVPL